MITFIWFWLSGQLSLQSKKEASLLLWGNLIIFLLRALLTVWSFWVWHWWFILFTSLQMIDKMCLSLSGASSRWWVDYRLSFHRHFLKSSLSRPPISLIWWNDDLRYLNFCFWASIYLIDIIDRIIWIYGWKILLMDKHYWLQITPPDFPNVEDFHLPYPKRCFPGVYHG